MDEVKYRMKSLLILIRILYLKVDFHLNSRKTWFFFWDYIDYSRTKNSLSNLRKSHGEYPKFGFKWEFMKTKRRSFLLCSLFFSQKIVIFLSNSSNTNKIFFLYTYLVTLMVIKTVTHKRKTSRLKKGRKYY